MSAQAKSYFHRGGNTPLLGATIAEHFAGIAERFADREAAVFSAQQQRLSYRELAQAVEQLARGLVATGFGKGDRIGIWIDYSAGNGGLYATLTGPRKPLTNGAILKACLRRPFGSRRVLGLIHWQALRLWWKGAGFRTRPNPPAEEISR